MLAIVTTTLFLMALVYAAVRDLLSYEIPNWISLAIVADYLVMAIAGGTDIAVVGWHLGAGLTILVAGILLFTAGIFGGGDAKLLAACAVWFGWSGLPSFFLVVAVAGGLFALAILIVRRLNLPAAWSDKAWLRRLRSAENGVPYGVAIGLGGLLILRDLPLSGLV